MARVYYPLLPSHPDMRSPDGCSREQRRRDATIDLGTRGQAESFIRALASLDPVRPEPGRRADDPEPSGDDQPSRPRRGTLARQGITAGMVRVSVGIEEPEDLWREFRSGLDAIAGPD